MISGQLSFLSARASLQASSMTGRANACRWLDRDLRQAFQQVAAAPIMTEERPSHPVKHACKLVRSIYPLQRED